MATITYTYKVKDVPDNATDAQIATKLSEADTAGFEFVGIFAVGTNQKAIFRKVVNIIE
jgi:hypothetical protein